MKVLQALVGYFTGLWGSAWWKTGSRRMSVRLLNYYEVLSPPVAPEPFPTI